MKIFDLHNDAVTDFEQTEQFISYNNSLDVETNVIFAIWSTRLSLDEFSSLLQIVKENKLNYAVEDCDLISGCPKILEEYKPKYCSLTWNYENSLAGGAIGQGRLTCKGVEFIERLNVGKIAVDLSHIGSASFDDVLKRADKTLISHCGIEIGNGLPRTPDRKQVESVIRRGGIIGATFVPQFYTDPSIDGFVNNVVDFIKNYGDDNLAIGSDFYGCNPIEGLNDYGSLPVLVEKLQSAGVSDCSISKILYLNAEKFFS